MPRTDRHRQGKKKKTRKTTFLKGHLPWNKDQQPISSVPCTESTSVNIPVCRPEKAIYDASILKYEGPPNTLPGKLRPKHERKEDEPLDNSSENIIVNFCKLKEFIKSSISHNCRRQDSFNVAIAKRKGLCVCLQASCTNCGFDTGVHKLYTECTSNKRGPAAGCLNEGLSMATVKSKMGGTDVQMLMACLDIRAPSLTIINNKINKQCEKMIELNEKSMVENQKFAGQVATFIGEGNNIDVETDTCFNNRNQTGYEAGTQSFCPVIEKTTGLNLPIAMATASKLCSKINMCTHENNKCSLTYNPDESISSSESKLTTKNLQKIHDLKIVSIKSLTSDASSQISKVVREVGKKNEIVIKYFQCFVHRLRTIQKKVKSIQFLKLPAGYDQDIFRQKLATCIRSRVRLELVRIKKKYPAEGAFVTRALMAMKNIVTCFSGSHTYCAERSLACNAHLESFSTQYLPYGSYLSLVTEDRRKLESVMNKSLTTEILNKIANLYTTNQCESLHHRVFTYAPKSVLFSRNFNGLCHSACHSSTFGTGKSSVLLAKSLGLNFSKCAPFFRYMTRKDILALYHSQRKKTPKYKIQRYLAKCRKSNRKIRQGSLYSNACNELVQIHNYAINVNKH
uniref:Mutator-like transposase domain-containing protein n=1 Tax=Magallana gigas TaxID=29159 RepID=K1QL52_MAGGI